MRDKYTIEDEIALINNKFRGEVKDITEYDDYQAVRVTVKAITCIAEPDPIAKEPIIEEPIVDPIKEPIVELAVKVEPKK